MVGWLCVGAMNVVAKECVERACWSSDGRGGICGGTVTWSKDAEETWSGLCAKCSTSLRATTGRRADLEIAIAEATQ